MKKLLIFSFFILAILALVNCDPSNGNDEPPADNPVPTLTSISPTSKVSHMPSFTLTVEGTNFISVSKIVFNGTEKPTTYVSATELTCQVDPDNTVVTASISFGSIGQVLDDNVHVMVRNPPPGGGDSNPIDFTILSNPTFITPVNISNTIGGSYSPDIIVNDSGKIHVTWNDYTPGNDGEIYFRNSTDYGATWNPTVNISNTPSNDSREQSIAMDSSGNLNVVWEDDTSGLYHWAIYFSRSIDNGVNWSTWNNISNQERSYDPTIAVDSSDNLNVVWCDFNDYNWDIYFKRSTDNGNTWSTYVNTCNNLGSTSTSDFVIDSADNFNLIWEEKNSGNWETYFSRSTDNGSTWISPVNVSDNTSQSRFPVIAAYNTANLNVFWQDYILNVDIYFSRSADNGTTWSTPVNISNTGDSSKVDAAVDLAGNINVAWHDNSGSDSEIYFTRSIDNGANWSVPVKVYNTPGHSAFSDITVDSSGNIYIAWLEEELPSLNREIYFTRSTL